jgi:parallel beta-helix repeat protein
LTTIVFPLISERKGTGTLTLGAMLSLPDPGKNSYKHSCEYVDRVAEEDMKKAGTLVAVLVFIGISFTAFSILPEGVRAATLYVGGGGPGNYTTIQGAIDAALPGDTIFAYNGTYNERPVIDKTLSLVGESRDSTWINGGGSGDTIYVTADWVNLTGFLVLNGGLIPWDAGIELDHVQNCDISGNNFFVNDYNGIFLRSSHNNTIASNNVAFNADLGIYLLSSHNNTIIDNNVSFNRFNIALDSSNDNIIANNNASNSDSGIFLSYSDDNFVTGNNASDNTNRGIFLEYSNNARIENNTASNNTNEGIYIQYSQDNTVSGNNVSHNEAGVHLYWANGHSVVNNTASGNVYGIHIHTSMYGRFAGNVMIENGFYLDGSEWEWSRQSIDTSNTVNGRPVHYWKNANGGTVPLNAGQVLLGNCTGVTVKDQNLSNGTIGIGIGGSSGNTITNNTVTSNKVEGILLVRSTDNTVSQNTIRRNGGDFNGGGIIVGGLGENEFIGNTVSLNLVGIGFRGGAHRNSVDNNTISGNDFGLELRWSNRNVITNNSIRSNRDYGIWMIGFWNSMVRNQVSSNGLGIYVTSPASHNNSIHHNDFVGNAEAAYDDGNTDNQWDDGYPSGGNYWSDYTGVDLSSGPNQDQPGSDGIGDTPYDKIGVNEDRYPLMSPLTTIMPRPPESLRAYLSGDGLENVTLEWDISPDDGSGLGSVVGYEVYRGSAYSPDGSGYGLIASLPNGTLSFVDNYGGEGDPDNHFYRVCAVDLANNSACAEDQAGKFTRPLSQGPSLISIPLVQSDESIETVLQTVEYDKAWSYDSSSQRWIWSMTSKGYRRGLFNVNHTMGMWVNITEDCNLTVVGIVPSQTTIHLHTGWNLVSFPSFDMSFSVLDLRAEISGTRVEGYDFATPPNFLRMLGDVDVLQAEVDRFSEMS